jgi:hypothetical protein
MTGINQRHLGFELGVEVKLGSMFALFLASSLGDFRYSNSPSFYLNAENGMELFPGEVDKQHTVYWKNYFVAGTPQIAETFGVKFNHDYWWVTINANYFDRIFIDMNADRRTSEAIGINTPLNLEYDLITGQTRMKGQFTLDLSVSKSWRIKRNTVGFNISVTNILNNKNLVTNGWEQSRSNYDGYISEKFPNKYYYAFGTTFFAGFNFTFN